MTNINMNVKRGIGIALLVGYRLVLLLQKIIMSIIEEIKIGTSTDCSTPSYR